MPLTPEQKRDRRRQEREAALAGDPDAQQRRAAERERIDKRFAQRTAAEQQERMKERRQRVRGDADAGNAKANELLSREAHRQVSRRNAKRVSQAAAAVVTDGADEFVGLFAQALDASHIRKYLADHPDSTPGVGWFSAVVTPELLQNVRDARQSALVRLYAVAFYRAAVAAIFSSCLGVASAFGPVAARVALAQRLLEWEDDAPWGPDEVEMATDHHTGAVEIPTQLSRLWTGEMRRGLWAEAWEMHKDAFTADLLRLGHEPAVCHAAAVSEIQRRVDELTTGFVASLGPPPVGGFGHEWWPLRYDGCQLCGRDQFIVSDRGLPTLSAEPTVSACLNALYTQAPYARMRIWVVHEAIVGSDPFALGVGNSIPPTRASLGLTPWSAATATPPVAPSNAYGVATIEYGDVSNRGSSDARDRACRLFVQNLSWGSGEAELTAHLDTVIPGGVVSVSVLRHADGRSRGIAKVVVQAPIDTQTVIEELNGKELDGRVLEIARDRL
jgi:hypothetical protein